MSITQRELYQQLSTEAASLHERIAGLARRLDPEQLVRRPTPPGWSVGEVLEHLCVADELYAKPLGLLLHRARPDAGAALREWRPSLVGRLIADRLGQPAPMKAPRWFRPGASPRPEVLDDFLARDARLARRMSEAQELDWRELRMGVPKLPFLKLNLGDVFRISVVHVRRHLGQMERVARGIAG